MSQIGQSHFETCLMRKRERSRCWYFWCSASSFKLLLVMMGDFDLPAYTCQWLISGRLMIGIRSHKWGHQIHSFGASQKGFHLGIDIVQKHKCASAQPQKTQNYLRHLCEFNSKARMIIFWDYGSQLLLLINGHTDCNCIYCAALLFVTVMSLILALQPNIIICWDYYSQFLFQAIR